MSNEIPVKALNHLSNIFGDSANDVSLDDIWVNTGRQNKPPKTNTHWLYNVLVDLTRHNLITKTYDGRKLKRIKLTDTGKKALGRDLMEWADTRPVQTEIVSNTEDTEVLLERVNRDIGILQQKLPSFYVTFNIRPRRDVGMSERLQRNLKKF